MTKIIDFQKYKAKTNRENLIQKMANYFHVLMPNSDKNTIVAFAIGAIENRKNLGGIDEFNNLKPIALEE